MTRTSPRRWTPPPLVKIAGVVHAAAAAGLAFRPQDWPILAGVLAGSHGLIAVASMTPRSRWLGPNITRLADDRAQQGEIGLSFDDGPSPAVTPKVLDVLEANGARASFFCVGDSAERHHDLVTEIARRGHRVENHSFRHSKAFGFLGPRALRHEIQRTQDVLERATGRRPDYFRAPAGIHSPFLDPVLCGCGLQLVSWTRRGFDTVTRQADRILERLTHDLAAGDILVLHDGTSARSHRGSPVVVEVLPRLLDVLRDRSLRAVAL